MPFTPITVAGTLATLVDRIAANIDTAMSLQAVKPDGEGIVLTYDARAGVLEALGRALQDMAAAETNNTIKTKIQAVATQLGVL